ncbi:EndoU domain-containing protein [Thermoactinomyces intermedius]|uniref:EndoU domain-containing protein n=1 Tax=Thermoactinomyces intermedius TaxID=2024 RepID=A0A8I1AEK8_THEIN|nr:EndoU domain-containing protein [Thermoactinomyces intermedius]MBA4550101.1 EndoU domain-containing protein [Thermoactinomyces intermedius]MBA4837737.1 EndoU domain-containing protein [Thermoactinomyces intermedius]MBH8596426.1 EndoU domain-containing protein [Thermoactinomyces intermedius]
MKTHQYWLVVLLMMLTGLGVLGSGTGYADPNTGSFEVPEVKEDFEEFEHKPDAQKEQPVNETQVQTEEKGYWDQTKEAVKEGWHWLVNVGSAFMDWVKETAEAFWEAFEKILSLLTSVVIVAVSFLKGVAKAVYDTVEGIFNMIRHPIDTLKGLYEAITHPVETAQALWQVISESFMRDVVHGDARSRAEWFGYVFGEIGLAVFGTKGLDKVGKAAKASRMGQKAGEVLGKLPKVFTADFWKNKVLALADKFNLNWKTLISGAVGVSLAGLSFFGIPKIFPAIMKVVQCGMKSVAYEQPADNYTGMILLLSCNTKKPKKADPHKVVNELKDFQSKTYQFGNETFLLDKSGMKHILERHHPKYWDGSVKQKQTFFDEDMTTDEIVSAIETIMQQNRETLIKKGTKFSYQIRGTYKGKNYVVGFNRGRVGQFYPEE